MKLNLGCGGYKIEGFVNIDNRKMWKPDIVVDVSDLPYIDNSVDFIYAGHILEHFTYQDGIKALKEWKRVLKPGAELQVVVPDIPLFATKLHQGDIEIGAFSWGVLGYDVEQPHESDRHRFLYSRERLTEVMTKAGFKDVTELDKSTNKYIQSDADWQILMRGEA